MEKNRLTLGKEINEALRTSIKKLGEYISLSENTTARDAFLLSTLVKLVRENELDEPIDPPYRGDGRKKYIQSEIKDYFSD